jgi:hypothetical protein
MPNIIQLTSVSGLSPYDIYVCDITDTYCFLVYSATTIPPLFSFIVPPPLDNVTSLLLKMVDMNGCENFILLSCGTYYGKEFENDEVFLFMDNIIYLFEGP